MIENYLNTQGYMLFDRAFGTYYAQRYAEDQKPCEMANLNHPKRVAAIHQEYIEAGADAIKTNTFSANEQHLECSWEMIRRILQEGYRIAKEAAKDKVKVFADIGPIMEQKMYLWHSSISKSWMCFLRRGRIASCLKRC